MWWHTLEMPATWDPEIRRTTVQAWPGQKCETQSEKLKAKGLGGRGSSSRALAKQV